MINFILNNNIIIGDTLKPSGDNDEVQLIAYHFNNNNGKVSLARAPLNDLDNEYDRTDEVDIMDIVNISFDDEVTDF